MSLASFTTQALIQREHELGQTFTWSGTTYPCARRATRKGNDPLEGGTWLTASGGLTVRRSLLPSIPKEGASIVIDGVTYTALAVIDDPALSWVRIEYGRVPKQ